jgi:hypothetical protein
LVPMKASTWFMLTAVMTASSARTGTFHVRKPSACPRAHRPQSA